MNTDQLSDTGLQIDDEVRHHFIVSAKWAKFIAITMFILAGLFLLIGLAGSSFLMSTFGRLGKFGTLAGMSGGIFLAAILMITAIFAVIYYFLFNFSFKIKESIATGNSDTMNTGLSSLKIYFIIYGIFGILSLLVTVYSLFQTSKYL